MYKDIYFKAELAEQGAEIWNPYFLTRIPAFRFHPLSFFYT